MAKEFVTDSMVLTPMQHNNTDFKSFRICAPWANEYAKEKEKNTTDNVYKYHGATNDYEGLLHTIDLENFVVKNVT